MTYTMNLNDGTDITDLQYKPDVGEIIKIDETGKWYQVTHVNDFQEWCSCKQVPDQRSASGSRKMI